MKIKHLIHLIKVGYAAAKRESMLPAYLRTDYILYARSAKCLFMAAFYRVRLEQKEHIISMIKRACYAGECELHVPDLYIEVSDDLNKLGYKIEIDEKRDMFKISWYHIPIEDL